MPDAKIATMSIDELRAEVVAEHGSMLPSIGGAMAEITKRFAYDMVWAREGLSPRDRSIATIAALAATDNPFELKMHALRGLSNGLTKDEIGEILLQLTPYVGIPLVVSAAQAVGQVLPRAKEGDTMSGKGL
jgi:4-carboxymuconolactone decarboxylase